jgi:hypothetical protein
MNGSSTKEETIDILVQGPIFKEPTSGWLCVEMLNSAEVFGTRMPVKVSGTVDGQAFDATLLPLGNGNHMIPIRAALRKQIQKDLGDEISIHLLKRITKA